MAKTGRKPVADAKARELFRLVDSGMSRDRAAKQIGMRPGTAATLLHKRNLERREEKRVAQELQPPGTG